MLIVANVQNYDHSWPSRGFELLEWHWQQQLLPMARGYLWSKSSEGHHVGLAFSSTSRFHITIYWKSKFFAKSNPQKQQISWANPLRESSIRHRYYSTKYQTIKHFHNTTTKKVYYNEKNHCNNIRVIAIVYTKCCNKIWGNKFVLQIFFFYQNCLLQQQIYYYIKIFIKIFMVYYNEINFFVAQTYYLKFYYNTLYELLQWLWCHCNDFFCCNKHFLL